ncbi:hypothetical protein M569_04846, partial [Genlisea aurea]
SPVDQNSLHGYNQSPGLRVLSPVGSNTLSGLASVLSPQISSPVKMSPIGKDSGRMSIGNSVIPTAGSATQGLPYTQPFSVSDMNLSSSPSFSDSKLSSVSTLTGPQFLWGSPTVQPEQVGGSSPWSSSLKGQTFASRPQGGGGVAAFPYAQHGSVTSPFHHVGSAPSGIPLERRFGFLPESPETSSYMNQPAFGLGSFSHSNGTRAPPNMGGSMNMVGVAFAGNFPESSSPGSRMVPLSRNSPVYFGNGSFGVVGGTTMNDLIDRGRIRRVDTGIQMDNKKQYQLELDKILHGEDNRTTLMIKNIPNKYTSKMLLAAIDETHMGAYDFLYLPIDFKNKCNVGYAFINMVSPSHIISFYEAFNGKKWEKFNSEKVASLAYARIQGRTALVSHFQNSSLMNEDKRCRPILFQSEGQETGDLDGFPSGNLNIFIRQPDGSYAGDSLDSPKSDCDE